MTVRAVAHHLLHNLRHLHLQLVNKLVGIILLVLNVAQLLFPDARQLRTLQQLFVDEVNQFYTRRSSHQVLALLADVVTLEQGLDDGGAG